MIKKAKRAGKPALLISFAEGSGEAERAPDRDRREWALLDLWGSMSGPQAVWGAVEAGRAEAAAQRAAEAWADGAGAWARIPRRREPKEPADTGHIYHRVPWRHILS